MLTKEIRLFMWTLLNELQALNDAQFPIAAAALLQY